MIDRTTVTVTDKDDNERILIIESFPAEEAMTILLEIKDLFGSEIEKLFTSDSKNDIDISALGLVKLIYSALNFNIIKTVKKLLKKTWIDAEECDGIIKGLNIGDTKVFDKIFSRNWGFLVKIIKEVFCFNYPDIVDNFKSMSEKSIDISEKSEKKNIKDLLG